jgi:hypothetical protein
MAADAGKITRYGLDDDYTDISENERTPFRHWRGVLDIIFVNVLQVSFSGKISGTIFFFPFSCFYCMNHFPFWDMLGIVSLY